MAITLDALTLPEDLIWIDEFDWTPVQQNVSTTLTGAIIVESSARLAGRMITLAGSAESGWADRLLLTELAAKAENPTLQMVLELNDNRTFNVIFRHNDTPIEARPIIDYNSPDDTDPYSLILRFMEI